MLTTIREKTQGIIATFILALIGIPFALWGINSYFEGGTQSSIATVNGEKISQQDYRATLEGFQKQTRPGSQDRPEVKQAAIGMLVDQVLLVRDAQEQGYRVSSTRLAKRISELPEVQTNGRFDPARYQIFLLQRGMTAPEFESRVRADVITNQLGVGLAASGIVTESEITALLRLLNQEREIAHAVIGPDNVQSKIAIPAEEIEQYYKAHPELFSTQEQVRIEYVRLSAPDLNKGYQPTEEELRQAYAGEISKNVLSESRRAAHVFVPLPAGASDDDAKKALSRIREIETRARSGVNFNQLAPERAEDISAAVMGTDLGDIRRDDKRLPKSFVEAVFSLKLNGVSAPLRTDRGYHLIKLTAIKSPVQQSFAELKPQLVKQLHQRKGEERFYEATEKFRNLVYEQADSLAPVAEALGLKAESSDWFGRDGGQGVAGHPRVIEAAFSPEVLTQHRNSDAIELSGDTLVAIHVAGHRPVEPKPLADVRPQIERTLRQEAAQKAMRELGATLVAEIAAGQSLEVTARKYGLKYQSPKMISREQPKGLDRRLVDAAFRIARPVAGKAEYDGVELGAQGYAVYGVTRVQDGDPAIADVAARDKAKRMLETHRGVDYYTDYRIRLKQKADIKIAQDRL